MWGSIQGNQCHLAGLVLSALGKRSTREVCHENWFCQLAVKEHNRQANVDWNQSTPCRHFLLDFFLLTAHLNGPTKLAYGKIMHWKEKKRASQIPLHSQRAIKPDFSSGVPNRPEAVAFNKRYVHYEATELWCGTVSCLKGKSEPR